jgi:hypothetical protein
MHSEVDFINKRPNLSFSQENGSLGKHFHNPAMGSRIYSTVPHSEFYTILIQNEKKNPLN